MKWHNAEIAEQFSEVADLLEIEGANPFRVRAYRNAARTLGGCGENICDLLQRGADLSDMPGIGKDLAGKIATLVETGRLPVLEEARAKVPPHVRELLRVPGLGPKRVRTLCEDMKIHSLEDLRAAADKGLIHAHAGFGEKTERHILEELRRLNRTELRLSISAADEFVSSFLGWLKKIPGVKTAAAAGSYRRRKETVGDLDLLVPAEVRSVELMERCVAFEEVERVLAKGETKGTVKLRSGIQVDIRVVPPKSFGAALLYFTGSKAHNIHLRRRGQERGLKLNEYGVFREGKELALRTELEIYRALGLAFIEPELREDTGEIEAAECGALPDLLKLSDIRGDLHCHTNESDGRASLEEMAEAARSKGYEYLAISDHSRRVTMAHGLDEKRLRQQMKKIDAFNSHCRGFRLLKSCEVDILEDGRLDLPDSILADLDVVTCSIHYQLNLPPAKQTERLLRAIDNPHCDIIGHPTGRLINRRPPYELDLPRIVGHARETGVCLEINSQPERLDLNDVHCRLARDVGAKLVISTDAHAPQELEYMRYGVDQARRGWLEKKNVVNTRSFEQLAKFLRRSGKAP